MYRARPGASGSNPVLGLLPGAGDLIAALVGGYGLIIAQRLGAPASIQLRMLMNLLIDAAIGAIPIAGDLFDFAFKAQLRNARLLEEWLSRPRPVRRSSVLVLLAVLIALLALVIGAVWIVFIIVRALVHLVATAAG